MRGIAGSSHRPRREDGRKEGLRAVPSPAEGLKQGGESLGPAPGPGPGGRTEDKEGLRAVPSPAEGLKQGGESPGPAPGPG
ncbi:MAG: hypothetical protein LBT40_11565, partial [Deltaproteobacteria bacterium]|nr:hypothetical protein [Deltaproteobacteria bacterium]